MSAEPTKQPADFIELDNLVNAELDALLTTGRVQRADVEDGAAETKTPGIDERVVYAHPFAEKRAGGAEESERKELPNSEADVVDFKLERKPAINGLFSAEEENFISSTSTWLRDRENADVVLDEVWRLVIGFDDEDIKDDDEGERQSPKMFEQPEEASEADMPDEPEPDLGKTAAGAAPRRKTVSGKTRSRRTKTVKKPDAEK